MVQNDSIAALKAKHDSRLILVEYNQINKAKSHLGKKLSAKPTKSKSEWEKLKNLKIDSLVPKYDYGKKSSDGAAQKVYVGNSSKSLSRAIEKSFHTAQAMGLKEAAESIPAFKIIAQRIDRELKYPEDFQAAHLYGNFKVYFSVNEKGQIQNDVQVSEGQNILIIYTLMALKQALKEELPEKLHLSSAVHISAEFNFGIKIDDTSVYLGEKPDNLHFKNYMSFHREGRARSRFNRWMHEVVWKKLPPILPFPGGVFVDFVALYDYLKDLGKPLPGEVRQFRLDLLQNKIERNLSLI